MKICHIIGAGEFAGDKFAPQAGDLIIACDGGLTHLNSIGVRPHVLVGDFDSLSEELPQDV